MQPTIQQVWERHNAPESTRVVGKKTVDFDLQTGELRGSSKCTSGPRCTRDTDNAGFSKAHNPGDHESEDDAAFVESTIQISL